MLNEDIYQNRNLKEIFNKTNVIKKPISGIISGYHEISYILITPDDSNPSFSVEVSGTIKVSPKFVISPNSLGDSFGDIFDKETFDKEIQARMFSFVYSRNKNVKLENVKFQIINIEVNAEKHVNKIHEQLLREENLKTGLILGPQFRYYPISLDKFVSEILDREFTV